MINILFGGNYKVSDGILLALISMSRRTKEALNVYVLTADLTEMKEEYKPITPEDNQLFNKAVKAQNPNSQVTLIKLGQEFNDWVNKSPNKLTINVYTPYTFLRFFSNKIEGLPNKLLYLDTDIMFNGDVKELFDIDVSNYELGIAKDRYGKIFIGRNYFNSGMLLMNMDKCKETQLFDRTKDMCLTKKMAFGDQDALNRCAKYKLYLPRRFNEQGNLRKDTVVQHFTKRFTLWPYFHTVNIKPWHIDKVHKVRKNFAYDKDYEVFYKIKNITPAN